MTDNDDKKKRKPILYRETSREAWESWQPVSGKLDVQILAAIKHFGRLTCQAIEELLDAPHQSVSGNLRHIVERGEARPSGEFGFTRAGRRAILWELPPAKPTLEVFSDDS